MRGERMRRALRTLGWKAVVAAGWAGSWACGSAGAQADGPPPAEVTQVAIAAPIAPAVAESAGPTVLSASDGAAPAAAPITDDAVRQAQCATCGGGLMAPPGPIFPNCGPNGCGQCYPGRTGKFCCDWCGDSCVGQFFNGIMNCVCCPDPCYEPCWVPAANAAFFTDAARPKTQMRLRWDEGLGLRFPDRSEYYWAAVQQAQGVVTKGANPGCDRTASGRGPKALTQKTDLNEFTYYTEGATNRIGVFVEIPYRRVDPDDPAACAFSGFADMNVGTKTLLLDCELLQVTLQMKTFIPIGQASHGLGTGHVSLEPALLWALKLTPSTYLQAETAYWIPIGGDQVYAGDIFHYHLSLNQVLCKPCCGVQLIGTAEFNGWAVLDGAYTDPFALGADGKPIPQSARGHICSAGPGFRVDICERIDFGAGMAFGITDQRHRWQDQLYRAEFRWRF
jgi:hypothetical protein